MVLISKDEAKKLNENYGIRFGENGISHTVHKRHYYLTESKRNLNALKKIREK